MPKLFISRRLISHDLDTAEFTYRLYRCLKTQFGEDSVFMDVDIRGSGLDALTKTRKTIIECDVLLAVIGEGWLDKRSERGMSRLQDPNDHVRIEIETALFHGIPVLPVIVGHARMPYLEELPVSLKRLAEQRPLLFHYERYHQGFRFDERLLIETIKYVLSGRVWAGPSLPLPTQSPPPSLPPVSAPPRTGGGGGLVAIGMALASIPTLLLNSAKNIAASVVRKAKAFKEDFSQPMYDTGALPPPPPPSSDDAGDPGARSDNLQVAVFAPPQVARGQAVLIQVFCYVIGLSQEARKQAVEFDEDAVRRGVTTLAMPVRYDERLHFHLTLMELKIENPVRELIWKEVTSSVQFEVRIPNGFPMDSLVGTVLISRGSVPMGRIGFKVSVVSKITHSRETVPVGESATKFRRAFVSYSTDDIEAVIARLQLLRPPLNDIEVFQDVRGLEPGDQFADELYHRIDECDLFLLFWSSNSQKSQWVRREWEHALQRQGPEKQPPPTIFPVIIEGPPPASPPPELSHLNFNDYLMYFAK